MEKVLVLTNNVFAEQSFQNKLQLLSHEVYCSEHALKILPKELIAYFDILVLSETIPDQGVLEILSSMKDKNKQIVRKSASPLSIEEKKDWSEKGISGWLDYSTSVEKLREELDEITRSSQAACNRRRMEAMISGEVKFSKVEYRMICALLEQKDYFMTRTELCQYLWNEQATNSRLVQLSTMVNNIRRKVRLEGIETDAIKTLWNKGYQLSQSLDWDSFHKKM